MADISSTESSEVTVASSDGINKLNVNADGSINVGYSVSDATGSGSITAIDANALIGYGALASFTPNANTSTTFSVAGYATCEMTITGTWTGALVFEATADGTNWFTTNALRVGVVNVTGYGYTAPTPGAYRCSTGGWHSVRVRAVTAVTTTISSASVAFRASYATSPSSEPQVVIGTAPKSTLIKDNPVVMAGQFLNKVSIPTIDYNGVQVYQSYSEAISHGVITGRTGIVMGVASTNSLSEVPVRDSTYIEPSANAGRSISSSSPSDTAVGIGARTVRLTYFSWTFPNMTGPFTEDITLNGTTPVNTVSNTICFIESIEVLTVGSNGVNVGTITLYASAGGFGGAVTSIPVGARQTHHAHHYVPNLSLCQPIMARVNSSASASNFPVFSLRSRALGVLNAIEKEVINPVAIQGSQTTAQLNFEALPGVSGPARLVCYVTPTNTAVQTQRFELGYYEQ